MIYGPTPCVHSPSGPSMPSSYAVALHFSSHELTFAFPILRADTLHRTRCSFIWWPLIWWDWPQALILSLSLHHSAYLQSLTCPLIHSPTSPSIYSSIQLHTYPPTQVFRFVSTHLPIFPLLSHSLLQTTYLSICLFIHPSSLTHLSICSLSHPPTTPII